ncbi:MAG: hypothetical protein ASARMPRED_004039 [Alectoria sarmentosa]|nr:MAG: hypothetical protein ASARMPRED_004039 [Alectoria sarmentosa]
MTNGQRPSPSSTTEKRAVREDFNDDPQPIAASFLGNGPTASMPLREDRLIDASPPASGFLGSTSYSAVFTEGQSHIIIEDNALSREIKNRGSQPSKLPSWDSSKVMEGAEILSLLAGLSRYEPALNRWYKVQCITTITYYIRECIALVPPELKGNHVRSKSLVTLSHKVFLRTSTPCSLDAKISSREYPSFLMGENLCWEIVGLILTTLGLSAISMDEVQIYDECDSETNWKDLALQLLRAGDQCIVFCEQFGHLKDIGVTLILMNFILHTQVYGDADYHCWRKSGDLTTALFALGLHQEPKSELPFFLAEMHRKLFWFAYMSDKNFATFFGRPPMINGKYCLCKMPLDLEDNQLALEGEALARALNDLDPEGWNPNSAAGNASWLRVSFISTKFREEILELSLGVGTDDLDERARSLKERLRQSEKSLPLKLRDRPDRWVLERTVAENFFLLSKHLDFVYNDFLIERTLVKQLRVSPTELVTVSTSLLSSMLILTGNRHRQGWYANDLPWLIALYALPPAGVLALELLHHSRNKLQANYNFPRSEIIQKLSNLISSIDFIVRPTNGNFIICGQAKKMLQAILDTVLSPELHQSETEQAEPAAALDTLMEEGFDDQMWLNYNLDMDFWTSLEEHPLLSWPELPENL